MSFSFPPRVRYGRITQQSTRRDREMMERPRKLGNGVKVAALLAVIAVCAAVTLWCALGGTGAREAALREQQVRRQRRDRKDRASFHRQRRGEKPVEQTRLDPNKKPQFGLEADEEAKLTDIQRKMLEEIRDACDEDDRKKVIRLVQQMQASEEWPDGIPAIIKLEAIDALGWFGIDGLAELAGFLKDADPEVQKAAVDGFDEALSDPDIGDRQRAEILKVAAQVITDADALESMMMELDDMRNSVAVEVSIVILKTGTDEAKAALLEASEERFEFETEDETELPPPKTEDEFKKWLEQNPDDEDDEDFYGPEKNDDDDE